MKELSVLRMMIRKSRIMPIAAVLIAITALLGAQTATTKPDTKRPDKEEPAPSFRKIENKAFTVGEELSFDVNYGPITAGYAKMMIPRWSEMGGRKCYHVEFTVRSTPFFDPVYNVRDRYQTHIDAEGLVPWKFVQQIREGSFKSDYSAWFDQRRNKAITKKGEFDIAPDVQDILSAFYFMRTQNYEGFKPGQEIQLKNFYKDTTHTLIVRYHGKEVKKVEAGTFNTIVLEPVMQAGGLFKSSGKILVWLTDDERKVPILVEAEIPIGSIKSELTAYKGVAGPIRAKIK